MILLVLIILLGLFLAGFYFAIQILHWLTTHLAAIYNVQVAVLSPVEAIMSIMQLTLLLLLIVCLPLVLLAIISYIRPALYANERRLLLYAPLSLVLGVLGSLFSLYLSLNIFIPYFDNFSQILGVQNLWSLERLAGFIIGNLFVFFLIFQVPLVIRLLHALGWIKIKDVHFLRKVIIVISLIVAALVTPPDVPSQLIVAFPFYLLFELSIQYCRYKEKSTVRSIEKIKAKKKLKSKK